MLEQDESSKQSPNFIQEALFIGNVVFAIFLIIALISHNPTDPGWSKISSQDLYTSNVTGYWGAWVSNLLFYFFGYIAYTIPPLYFGMTLIKLLSVRDLSTNPANIIRMLCTSTSLMITFSALSSIYISSSTKTLP